MKKNETVLKILGLGDSGVGQTSVLSRYIENEFFEDLLATIGIDFKTININLNKGNIKLKILDTPGQEFFRNLIEPYTNGVDAIILIYNVNSRNINT